MPVVRVGEPPAPGDLAEQDPLPRHLHIPVAEHPLEEHPARAEGDPVTHGVHIVVLRPAPVLQLGMNILPKNKVEK